MDQHTIAMIAIAVVTAVFGVLGYLLRRRDDAQEEQIRVLFKKHDDDVAKLQTLEVKVASQHYEKPEVDGKITDLKEALREGFRGLRDDFKELASALREHITKETK